MNIMPTFGIVRIIDIDGVIFRQLHNDKPTELEPLPGSVEQINEWFDDGDLVVIWTARSPVYAGVTRDQLDSFGVKYHYLLLGKPLSDEIHIYDDKIIISHKLEMNAGLESLPTECDTFYEHGDLPEEEK